MTNFFFSSLCNLLCECNHLSARHLRLTQNCSWNLVILNHGHLVDFWLTWKMWVYVNCNDQCWAGRLIVQHDKNFNIAIFVDTIGVINVKLSMMVVLYWALPSHTIWVTLIHCTVYSFRSWDWRPFLVIIVMFVSVQCGILALSVILSLLCLHSVGVCR